MRRDSPALLSGTGPPAAVPGSGAASGGAIPAIPAMAPGVNIKEELADIMDEHARAEETRRYLDAIALAHHRQLMTEMEAAEYAGPNAGNISG